MFGPVFTTEAHLAFAEARFHSNGTAEISAVEALSFLGPYGPVARDACSCVFYHFKHASGVCLGTILARTDVQLGLSCQQLLLKVQHKPRCTMQHVHNHAENLGNECADHAAALGASAWCGTKIFPHVGRVTLLIPLVLCYLPQPWRCSGKITFAVTRLKDVLDNGKVSPLVCLYRAEPCQPTIGIP